MISEIHLKNFRGFEDHVVPLRPMTVIVGRNNAGKSTIVEALRLVSLVVSRFKGELSSIPSHWQFPKNSKGSAPFKNLEINLQSIFHRYGDPPAIISATFASGAVIELSITPEAIVARRLRTKSSNLPSTRLSRVSILPQVGPVSMEERLLTPEYVRSAMSSALAPLHFRNQLYLLQDEHFDSFTQAAETTWPGLRVTSLEENGRFPDPIYLSLFVEDRHFTAEVAWMGHGLQMWLQTIWFLTRAKDHETVILDEPDVYMHADLQRRLIRFVRGNHQQVVIATHSSEIMAEVQPEDILVVNRLNDRSAFASSLPAVQKVLGGFGSVHNLQLSRLWTSRRFLMVEGEDIALLKPIQNTMFPTTLLPIDTIPSRSVEGWGGWNYAVGSEMFLENAGGEGIVTYCIFDSDYHTSEEIANRRREAVKRGISLHIWTRKELENYLLIPSAIQRAIQIQMAQGKAAPSVDEVEEKLETIAGTLKVDVIDCTATAIQSVDRKLTAATSNQKARRIVSERWKTQVGRFGAIPGKKALASLSRWVQENYKVSLGAFNIARCMTRDEIDDELKDVLWAIEEGEPFLPPVTER